MNEDKATAIGCLITVSMLFFSAAASVVVGRIFGAAIGFALLLVLLAALALVLAVLNYRAEG